MKLLNWFRSVLVLLVAPTALFGVCLVVFLAIICCRLPYIRIRIIPRLWGKLVCATGGVRVTVEGAERLKAGQPYIFAANHQSQFDIPVLEGYLMDNFCWMAKKELFQIPIFGRAMLATGFIPVDRGHGRKAMQSLIEAAKRIAAGSSVIIFPEGTRSVDGKLKPFKSGAMVLAIKAKVPVVPVAIVGTHKVLPKGSLMARAGDVVIKIGEPIDTSTYGAKQKQELAQRLMGDVNSMLTE